MGSFFKGKGQTSTSTSNSTTNMYQQDYFDKLLGAASEWFDQGGLSNSPNYISQMGDLLGQQASKYQQMMNGDVDREALSNALTAQADMAQQNLDRNILPSIGTASNMTGTSGSSRRGIAEGLAASDMSSQLQAQQAQTINQFEQQAVQNQMAGAAGMGNVFGQMGQLQGLAEGSTDQAKRLQSLLALQGLVGGNMGGTVSSTGSSTTPGQSPFGTLLGLGATAAGAMNMSDEKLKKKIKKVKHKGKDVKTKDGIPIKEWEWNDEAKDKYGLEGKSKGVIAQEAEKVRPDAVKKRKDTGDRMVNYGALM